MPTATPVDPKQSALDAIRKLTSLATLPEITTKIIATVEDPKSSASQLNKLIAHDPALVTRMLKLVNSSFYGLPGQISSIERAIVLLGRTAVRNVAVAASIGQMFRGAKLCNGAGPKELWTHCLAVAVAARELAKKVDASIAEEAFLGGMIHDVGLLGSLQVSPEKLRAVCERVQKTNENFVAVEIEMTGIDHAELGGALTQHWKFPQVCQDIARWHHDPAGMPTPSKVVAIVHIADVIACAAQVGFGLTAGAETIDEADLKQAGLKMEQIEEVKANLNALVETARGVLG